MKRTEIETENLRLLLGTPEEMLAWVERMSPEDRAQVSPDWLARVTTSPHPDPWLHGFSMTHRTSGEVIGSCGFKGPPGDDAAVEIAYGVDPAHQGRGYATEAAQALVAFAFGSGQVKIVRAHTLPNENASTRVLTKCHFEKLGEVMDPEDGLVWRWELQAQR
jgi:ribosomal-protein-alanine N-acetyltransferase